MLRHMKKLVFCAVLAPLLVLATADDADAQRRNRGDRDRRGVRGDRDGILTVNNRRGRRGYWNNYWRWYDNDYRSYWNRRGRYYNYPGNYSYNYNYRYGNPRIYGNRYYYGGRPYYRGSGVGIRLGNFGIRIDDWD